MKFKETAIITADELESIIGKGIIPHYDMDGLWFEYFDETITNIDEVVINKLSAYFDRKVSSIHIDDCDYVGVWVVFE